MSDPVNIKFAKEAAKKHAGLPGFFLSIGGTALLGGGVYLSYFLVNHNYAKTSWEMLLTGAGLIAAFLFLLLALVLALKIMISRRPLSVWPLMGAILSGLSLIGLLGLSILGIKSGSI